MPICSVRLWHAPVWPLIRYQLHALRQWDQLSAQRVDVLWRISLHRPPDSQGLGRDAEVWFPRRG